MKKVDLREFNYKQVANLDCRIWRAYYHHQFLRFAFLTYKLFRAQLGLGVFITIRIAYHFAVASVEHRLNKKHLESDKTIRHLVKFFGVISAHSLHPFDYAKAAKSELDWWNVHRYGDKDKHAVEKGMAETMAVVYQTKPDKLFEYGSYRAQATELRKKYMFELKIEPRWTEIEELLIKSWSSLHKTVQK